MLIHAACREARFDVSLFPINLLELTDAVLAVDQAEKRAFAFTVATQQTDPFSGLDLQLDLVQKARASKGQTDVSQAQQCHQYSQSCTCNWVGQGKPITAGRCRHGNKSQDRSARRFGWRPPSSRAIRRLSIASGFSRTAVARCFVSNCAKRQRAKSARKGLDIFVIRDPCPESPFWQAAALRYHCKRRSLHRQTTLVRGCSDRVSSWRISIKKVDRGELTRTIKPACRSCATTRTLQMDTHVTNG
jgi:hypothetical protein